VPAAGAPEAAWCSSILTVITDHTLDNRLIIRTSVLIEQTFIAIQAPPVLWRCWLGARPVIHWVLVYECSISAVNNFGNDYVRAESLAHKKRGVKDYFSTSIRCDWYTFLVWCGVVFSSLSVSVQSLFCAVCLSVFYCVWLGMRDPMSGCGVTRPARPWRRDVFISSMERVEVIQ